MNIFVAKLNYDTQSDTLQEAFEEYGEVSSCSIIMDKFTGKSKGFGFVEMPDSDANAAIEATNGKSVAGRNLVVNQAREREARPRFDRDDRGPRY